MSKKSIIIILIALLVCLCGISFYSTFAYNGDIDNLDASQADYNLIYSIKKHSNNEVTVLENETKYIDITLENTYTSSVKYAMYYKYIKQPKDTNNIIIGLADNSNDSLQGIIKPSEKKIISIKITNNTEKSIDLVVGSIVGFENGDIKDLIKNGETLIK